MMAKRAYKSGEGSGLIERGYGGGTPTGTTEQRRYYGGGSGGGSVPIAPSPKQYVIEGKTVSKEVYEAEIAKQLATKEAKAIETQPTTTQPYSPPITGTIKPAKPLTTAQTARAFLREKTGIPFGSLFQKYTERVEGLAPARGEAAYGLDRETTASRVTGGVSRGLVASTLLIPVFVKSLVTKPKETVVGVGAYLKKGVTEKGQRLEFVSEITGSIIGAKGLGLKVSKTKTTAVTKATTKTVKPRVVVGETIIQTQKPITQLYGKVRTAEGVYEVKYPTPKKIPRAKGTTLFEVKAGKESLAKGTVGFEITGQQFKLKGGAIGKGSSVKFGGGGKAVVKGDLFAAETQIARTTYKKGTTPKLETRIKTRTTGRIKLGDTKVEKGLIQIDSKILGVERDVRSFISTSKTKPVIPLKSKGGVQVKIGKETQTVNIFKESPKPKVSSEGAQLGIIKGLLRESQAEGTGTIIKTPTKSGKPSTFTIQEATPDTSAAVGTITKKIVTDVGVDFSKSLPKVKKTTSKTINLPETSMYTASEAGLFTLGRSKIKQDLQPKQTYALFTSQSQKTRELQLPKMGLIQFQQLGLLSSQISKQSLGSSLALGQAIVQKVKPSQKQMLKTTGAFDTPEFGISETTAGKGSPLIIPTSDPLTGKKLKKVSTDLDFTASYNPSLEAGVFNIKGVKPSKALIGTGISLRPIPR